MKAAFNKEIETTKNMMTHLPWEDRAFYASYLAQTYYFVRHSTRLLAMASGHARQDQADLHRRFGSHIGEEKGHDLLALNDLKQLGYTEVESELAETRNLYEGQYYKVEKLDSAALLGYILALEGVASMICPDFIGRIYEAHGEKCAKFLKLHVEEDPDHVEKAFEQIEKLPKNLQEMVETNLIQSFKNYRYFLQGIEEAAQEKRKTAPIARTESVLNS